MSMRVQLCGFIPDEVEVVGGPVALQRVLSEGLVLVAHLLVVFLVEGVFHNVEWPSYAPSCGCLWLAPSPVNGMR
jgi:hypothetical protein